MNVPRSVPEVIEVPCVIELKKSCNNASGFLVGFRSFRRWIDCGASVLPLREAKTMLLTDGTDSFVKDCLQILLSQSRALKVLHSPNILLHLQALLIGDWGHAPS